MTAMPPQTHPMGLPTIDGATRRDVLRAAAVLGLLLVGCTGDEDASSAGAGSRTVEHAFGTTTLPTAPTRVATINGNEILHLLSLGVSPVAAPEWILDYGDRPDELVTALDDAEGLGAGAAAPVDLEQVAALEPDLILAQDGTVDEIYDELSQIAPTVVVRFEDDWRDSTRLVGQALGRDDAAVTRIEEVEAAVAALADTWGEQLAGRSYTLMAPFPADGQYYLYSLTGLEEVLDALGMVRPEAQQAIVGDAPGRGSDYPPISAEQFDLLDADVLLLFGYGDASDVENRQVFTDDPLLRQLDVARRNAIYDVNSYTWYVPSAYGIEQVVRDLDERILPDLVGRLEPADEA